ncbi:hypothetical protein WL32_06800 [Burkholderia cepacia]|nr:hypothetical protein WL32_06800 [Burkholderia cepacia]
MSGTYIELLQQFNRFKQEIESARSREMRRFLGELVELLDKNGISLNDLIAYRAAAAVDHPAEIPRSRDGTDLDRPRSRTAMDSRQGSQRVSDRRG